MKPLPGTYPSYFENYIYYVTQPTLSAAFENSWQEILKTFSGLAPEMEDYAYEQGKWTVKQMLIHMIDTERVFAYRALRFGRNDPQMVSSFEENLYVANVDVSKRTLADLLEEYAHVRKASVFLFNNFSENALLFKGKTAAGEVTVLALGYIICGHALHHVHIFKELYAKSV